MFDGVNDYIKKITVKWNDRISKSPKGIILWPGKNAPEFIPGAPEPAVIPFLLAGEKKRGAAVICCGGAYMWKEPGEAFPRAKWLNSIGLHAFVLDYRVEPHKPRHALLDAQRAVRVLRHMSGELNIKKDKIALIGFSAGGHLTAMAATHFDLGDAQSGDLIERESCRPDAQILCYPHITYEPYIEEDPEFITRIFGEGYNTGDINKYNACLHVRGDTPPAFIWGMQGDWQYAQKHFKFYTEALDEKKIAYSYHIFPGGQHGDENSTAPVWKQWTILCELWLRDLGF